MSNIQSATYLHKNRVTSYAKDVYLLMLQGIFSQSNSAYHWDPDPDRSKLLIADRLHKPEENQSMKPMIYLTRGRMAYSKSSINQSLGGDFIRSKESFTDLIQGAMVINCVSSEGLEAEELASTVFTILQAYKAEFRKLGFHTMEVSELLEERPVESQYDSKLVEVAVVTQFTFQYTWCISTLDLEVLRDLCITRAMEADPPIEADGVCNHKAADEANAKKCRTWGPAPDKVAMTLEP